MKSYAFVVAFAGAALALSGTAAAQDKLVLRYSQWIPAAHFTQVNGLHKYFADVEKATEGRVKIEPTAQALGAPARHMQLAVDGISDVSWGAHGYTPGTYPLSEMVELPFVTKNTQANSVAYWRVWTAVFAKTGMHPPEVHTLGMHVHPAGHIYNNKRAVTKIEDLNGLKIRSTNTIVTEALKMFGATPLPMPVTQLRDSLSKGVADGTSFTDEAIFNFKIGDFIKHATRIEGGLYNTSFFLVMNKKKWDAIQKKDQDAMTALSGEALARRIGKMWDEEEEAAAPKLKALGVTYTVADAAMMAKFKSGLASFEAQWIEAAKKAGVDGASALKLFREEVAKN